MKHMIQYKDADFPCHEPCLSKDEDGLSLVFGDVRVICDFTKNVRRIREGNLNREVIVRAAKIKDLSSPEPLAIDATAGLGEDSLLLAAAGFHVLMYEKDPIIAALLRDGMRRIVEMDEDSGEDSGKDSIKTNSDVKLLKEAVSRMELIEGDSIQALKKMNLEKRPDVILLDPMFPEKQKSSLPKKKLQLIQMLERPCENEEDLLRAAISAGPRRIIIKRPLKGPYLAGKTPSFSLSGKTVRIDCIVLGG